MAVHFKFASSNFNLYDSIPLTDEFISLGDLKDAIFKRKFAKVGGRRKHDRFDLRLYDYETKEEIVGVDTSIRKNSCVVVRRVPLGPHDHIVVDSKNNIGSAKVVVCPNEKASPQMDLGDMPIEQEVEISKCAENPDLLERIQTLIKDVMVCSLCHDILEDPVLIPCCCVSFCCNCITKHMLEQEKCPTCGSSKFNGSHLLPNHQVKTLIHAYSPNSTLLHAI